MNEIDNLKLENQLCFPLYAASNAIIREYKPFLSKLDLTYTQYITMMCMWQYERINVKELGEKLFLDSGTLSPLLNKLEKKGYIIKERSKDDARVVYVNITNAGIKLKESAKEIPTCVSKCINLNPEESMNLYKILYKILGKEQ